MADDVKAKLEAEAAARKKQNEEVAKRMESSKPTPSQEENDRARLGDDVKDKADDGSGPEVHFVTTRQIAASEDKPAPATYTTRQTKPPGT
jgi:hypothetical protein